MEVVSQNENLTNELWLVVKLFYTEQEIQQLKLKITHTYSHNEKQLICNIQINNNKPATSIIPINKYTDITKTIKHNSKILLYNELYKLTKKSHPWGALTGIRPTKMFYDLKAIGGESYALNALINNYKVSKKRAKLLKEIIFHQKPHLEKASIDTNLSRGCIVPVDYYANNTKVKKLKKLKVSTNLAYPLNYGNVKNEVKTIDLYINIPFCTTKCYYCSFISQPLSQCAHLVQPYIEALIKEINATIVFLKHKDYIIQNVYVGGGTPTAITAEQLDNILKAIPSLINEFTVECGRADTITNEKLDVLKKHNVNRISINPQTFNDNTLKVIGRSHTAHDVMKVFNIARKYDFVINMDLIAGLANESFTDFKNTLKKTISLKPENITVHTLSIKRNSKLKTQGGEVSMVKEVEKMVNYSLKKLKSNGYKPYYLYRQKNTLANLENIGYFKDDYACKFNINSMEEVSSIIACGANGISKRVYKSTNMIKRCANVKDINEYISRIEEIILRKHKLFH